MLKLTNPFNFHYLFYRKLLNISQRQRIDSYTAPLWQNSSWQTISHNIK